MLADQYRQRAAAIDIVVLYANQAVQAMVESIEDAAKQAEMRRDLGIKAEWGIRMLGVTEGELEASSIRVKAYAQSVRMDSELEDLLGGGGNFTSEL